MEVGWRVGVVGGGGGGVVSFARMASGLHQQVAVGCIVAGIAGDQRQIMDIMTGHHTTEARRQISRIAPAMVVVLCLEDWHPQAG